MKAHYISHSVNTRWPSKVIFHKLICPIVLETFYTILPFFCGAHFFFSTKEGKKGVGNKRLGYTPFRSRCLTIMSWFASTTRQVFTLQCAVWILQCAECNMQCAVSQSSKTRQSALPNKYAVCSVPWAVCSVQYAVWSVQCAVCSMKYEVLSSQCEMCGVYSV